jgi:hypothetical protein
MPTKRRKHTARKLASLTLAQESLTLAQEMYRNPPVKAALCER